LRAARLATFIFSILLRFLIVFPDEDKTTYYIRFNPDALMKKSFKPVTAAGGLARARESPEQIGND
jgi:hypothetical protein